jgi:hypothetical protein
MEMKNEILNANQYVGATLKVIESRKAEWAQKVSAVLKDYSLSESDSANVESFILQNVEVMFGRLNDLQRWNILDMINQRVSPQDIEKRMVYYGSEGESVAAVVAFSQVYENYSKGLKVQDLETDFVGVQIATRDSLLDIRTLGYTGYWRLNPKRVKNRRIQMASMADGGPTPRGYYLNAEVVEVEEVETNDGVRYKVVLANAVIKNSGNPNVKFNRTPVTYIN